MIMYRVEILSRFGIGGWKVDYSELYKDWEVVKSFLESIKENQFPELVIPDQAKNIYYVSKNLDLLNVAKELTNNE
jgi:hypothetical protein